MNILAIDTTGHYASVALGDLQIKNDTDYSHLQEITPMCMEILAKAGLKGTDLDAIAVSRGPGSFTGIRIGMATAKGLAQIWNKPLICVPTLESFGYRDESVTVAPVFDARRGQVYAGVFKGSEIIVPGSAYDIEEFRKKIEGLDAHFYGDGTALIGKESEGTQEAKQVLKLAEIMFNEGKLETAYSAEPEYMRLAEAERKLKEKQNER